VLAAVDRVVAAAVVPLARQILAAVAVVVALVLLDRQAAPAS
jgi:hypothetical protein